MMLSDLLLAAELTVALGIIIGAIWRFWLKSSREHEALRALVEETNRRQVVSELNQKAMMTRLSRQEKVLMLQLTKNNGSSAVDKIDKLVSLFEGPK